jgi:alginate O-acetyltransferase complex protein AlgI
MPVLFVELRFLFFFLLCFGVYWSLPTDRGRKLLLLALGYVFYGAWNWRFLPLLFLSTAVDYAAGLLLSGPYAPGRAPRTRRLVLCASIVVNLGVLAFFKYSNFFIGSAGQLFAAMGLHLRGPMLSIVLPLGISFYTFESLSYTIDVYRGAPAERSLLDFALFLNFFPHLVAGPIVRAGDFLPQLKARKSFADVDARGAAVLFLIGFFKKAVVSDNVAPVVDAYFGSPERFAAAGAWLAVLLYAVQIYCDFSGYSDMAVALAALFGYRLNANFAHPYFATDIAAFWRRWHMSLSKWLRDYLYIPLGGNRGSTWSRDRNVMVTMLLGGLWHGAGANFVLWGGLHGLALVVHRRLAPVLPLRSPLARAVGGQLLTFYWVCIGWIFFRSSTVAQATVVLRAFTTFRSPGTTTLHPSWWLVLAALAALHWLAYRRALAGWWRRLPAAAFGGGYGAAWAFLLAAMPAVSRTFIYFQF